MTAKKIFIGVPSKGMPETRFMSCLTSMMCRMVYKGFKPELLTVEGSVVSQARLELLSHSLRTDADYLLFLDEDMMFPPTLFERLMEADKDVISTNYTTRYIDNLRFVSADMDWMVPDSNKLEGVQEALQIPTGTMLLSKKAMQSIDFSTDVGLSMSIFGQPLTDEGEYVTEDAYFCMVMRKCGLKLYLDHDLTKEIRHVGKLEYHASMIKMENKEDGKEREGLHPESNQETRSVA